MALARCLMLGLVGSLILAPPSGAQETLGTIAGRVLDAPSQQPLPGVTVAVEGTQRGALTQENGTFRIGGLPAGVYRVRATRVGYAPQQQEVTVAPGGTARAEFLLQPVAVTLSPIVATGYGTQRREAITGSVTTVDADEANVGVITNANEMIEGRVAGVNITQNSGEPGAGAQVRIRGGTSISASNEPLYVIDGIPINNVESEPAGIGIGGTPPLARSPLNLINPSDIESIVVLKDASATAIYGSRAANGVILIETKKGTTGEGSVEYESYVASSSPARRLDVLTGAEYRRFVEQQVQLRLADPTGEAGLDTSRLSNLGPANTDWERAVTRTGITHNHNLAFSGGAGPTRYRASLNYMDQEGVVIDNGLQRLQGRLNGNHAALENRLRLGLNLTSAHVVNDYLPFENTGGFEGGVFHNMVSFNPTRPVVTNDTATGVETFFEMGTGPQGIRNPVALARQIDDLANTSRTLGNITSELDVFPGLTAQLNLGVDRTESTRRIYFPKASPVGAVWEGLARQVNRDNTSLTLQSYLTFDQNFAEAHSFNIVGGYEFNDFEVGEFGAEAQNFITDALRFNSLGGGATLVRPYSWRDESRLISFFTRANYGFRNRYFVTGVLRRDGSSRFGEGNKWALFPALSASWRLGEEEFMRQSPLSDLRLRAGWGLQGNPGIPPYASLVLLQPGAGYVFGEQEVTGMVPTRNPNPGLKWEATEQYNVALDYGFLQNRFSGTVEYYVKNTSDLLLELDAPPPALVGTGLENVGKVRNRGLEVALDGVAYTGENRSWLAGLVLAVERNTVVDIGGGDIGTGFGSGQGQTGQVTQIIREGLPLGTFWGPRFVGVDTAGKQLFRCQPRDADDTGCVDGRTTTPRASDNGVIGNANPDFTLGLRSQVNWSNVDFSFLIRAEVGRDVFNNTALVYSTKGNALQDRNFLRSALNDPIGLREPAIFSSRWVEDGSFVRLQNITIGYTFNMPRQFGGAQNTRVYLSGDNVFLLTDYSGLDPEVHAESGLASRGIDYLSYPRARTWTGGLRVAF